MGFADKVREQQELQAQAKAARDAPDVCPEHYLTEVNKGSINMAHWQKHLNNMYTRGYRLAHVLEQDGNTVQVFEHHTH